jgi:hypothetical protein
VPLGDGRALISFDGCITVAGLELSLHDALDDGGLSDTEIFTRLAARLKQVCRTEEGLLCHRHIIALSSRQLRQHLKSAGKSKRRHKVGGGEPAPSVAGTVDGHVPRRASTYGRAHDPHVNADDGSCDSRSRTAGVIHKDRAA